MLQQNDITPAVTSSIAWRQPEPFSFVAEDWHAWKGIFTSFRRCSKLYKESEEDKIDTLYYRGPTMGAVEAKKITATFKFEGKYILDGTETISTACCTNLRNISCPL